MTNIANSIIRFRWLVICLTLLAVALIGRGGQNLSFSNDYRVFFSEDNPQLLAFETLQNTYIKNDNVMIMLEPKDGTVFTENTIHAVQELTELAWQLKFASRVDSISNFQYSYAEGDELIVDDLIPSNIELNPSTLARLKKIALGEPLLVQRLISPSAHVTAVNTTIQLPGKDPNTEPTIVVTEVRELVRNMEQKYPSINFFTTGVVMMNNAFPEATKTDFKKLIPLAFGLIIIGLLLFLRSLWATLATLVIIMFSIILAMGTAGWLGIKITPPSATAPTLILTLAVADCVHFLVTTLQSMRNGLARKAALVESFRVNANPIILTSVTTAIGFLSMNFSDAPPFRDLGNIAALGVIYALLLALIFLPAVISLLPISVRPTKSRLASIMERFSEWVIRHRQRLLVSTGITVAILIAVIPRNELNDIFVEYFDTSVPFRVQTDYITENLSGMYFIDYSLDTKNEDGINNPEYMRKLEAFKQWLETRDEVQHISSITEIMQRLNKNMHEDQQEYYRIPGNRELAAQYLLLYEMSLPYGLDLNNQINVDKSATRFSVVIDTLSTKEILKFEADAAQWLKENAPELTAQGSSPSVMFSHIGRRNINSMLLGTTVALVLISVLLIFALRSVKYGLISLLPNLLPAGMAFGLWGLLVGQVGLALSVVTAMTLGIVVDDTIHFLSKYLRARREQNLSSQDAVRYAFSTVGIALVVTSAVLAAGFLTLAQSAFELNSGMGLLTAITIGLALVVDFLFLPPLLMKLEESADATRTQDPTPNAA